MDCSAIEFETPAKMALSVAMSATPGSTGKEIVSNNKPAIFHPKRVPLLASGSVNSHLCHSSLDLFVASTLSAVGGTKEC